MTRLVLVDSSDQLPGLLPLHAWSALMASEAVLVGAPSHPFVPHLDAAGLRYEVVPPAGEAPLSRGDLLGGVSPEQRARADWIVDRTQALGEVAYLYGPGDHEAFTRTLGMTAARAQIEVEVVYFGAAPKGVRLLELVDVQARLRAPDGCPWDQEQTTESLIPYAVEEVHELAEAVAAGDDDAIREELGDLLLQVVFHAQIADDEERFDVDDVAGGIAEKLVRRHPHVFGEDTAADAASVMDRWEELKAAEKPERNGPFDGVVRGQPALPLAAKLLQRARRHDLPVASRAEAAASAREALAALVDDAPDEAGGPDAQDAVGRLLLAAVTLAGEAGVDAEQALRRAAQGFAQRAEGPPSPR